MELFFDKVFIRKAGRKMKRITMSMLAALVCAGMVAVSVRAEEGAAKPEKQKAPKPVLTDISVSGVISKTEEKKGEKTVVKYVLTDAQGEKIVLQAPKEGVNLDDYLDAAVTVNGKGMKTMKKDKEVVVIKEVVSVEKAAGAAEGQPAEGEKGGEAAGDAGGAAVKE